MSTADSGVDIRPVRTISSLQLRASQLLVGALAIVFAVGAADWYFLGIPYLTKFPPDFGASGLWRTGALGLAAFLAAVGLWKWSEGVEREDFDTRSWPFRAAMAASYGLLLLPLSVMVVDVHATSWLTMEYSFVEIGSALLLLASAAVLARSAMLAPTDDTGRVLSFSRRTITLAMAGTVFVIAMEEISWGQQVFHYYTPELFSGNDQRETNFHNYYTWVFENLYYGSALAAFVVAPFFWIARSERGAGGLRFYMPAPSFALIALPVAGFNYLMWNIPTIQFGFLLSIAIGVLAVRFPPRPPCGKAALAAAALLLVLGSQAYFLAEGDTLTRMHALSEFKELHIAFLLCIYALWLSAKIRELTDERRGASGRDNPV